MATYLDWMRSAVLHHRHRLPGDLRPRTTPDGLPVGIQVVAPHGADRLLLEVAAAIEESR